MRIVYSLVSKHHQVQELPLLSDLDLKELRQTNQTLQQQNYFLLFCFFFINI